MDGGSYYDMADLFAGVSLDRCQTAGAAAAGCMGRGLAVHIADCILAGICHLVAVALGTMWLSYPKSHLTCSSWWSYL